MTAFQSLDEIMREEEDRRLQEARAETAAETAAWAALTPEEQQAVIDAREAKWERIMAEGAEPADEPEPCSGCGDPDCDFDCDGAYDD